MSQTYPNLDIIVVDDGSCDRTVEIVNQLIQKDRRIRLLQQPNCGVAAARNLAIQNAKGEFIAPIDADDIWYPTQIQRQVQAMQQGGNRIGLVYSWSVDIDEQNLPTGEFHSAQIGGNVYTTLIAHNFIGNASATLIRRSCLDQVGGYDPELRHQQAQGCEDWDLYLRISERYEFQVVPEFLVGYRKLSNSMSGDYRTMAKSHRLIMASAHQRSPHVPSYLFNLSSSNLYIYFAHQCHRYQQHDITRFWLRQALAADKFSPWLRPGFYRLHGASLLAHLKARLQIILRSHYQPKSDVFQSPLAVHSDTQNCDLLPPEFSAPRLALWLTIHINHLFHCLVSIVVKRSKTSVYNHPTSSFLIVDK